MFGACVVLFALSIAATAAIAQSLATRAQLGRGAFVAGAFAAAVVIGVPWFLEMALGGVSGALAAAVLAVVIGVGVGCVAMVVPRHAAARAVLGAAALGAVAVLVWRAVPRYRADAQIFGKERARVHVHAAKLGTYVRDALPDAQVVAADACTVATYAERPVLAIDATSAAERFEWLERQGSSESRPTHVVAPPGWFGVPDIVGRMVRDGWFGRAQVMLSEIDWDHASTGERPIAMRTGWSVVDRIDVADTVSELGHAWDASTTSSLVARDTTHGLVLDGGRTFAAGETTFTVTRTPGLLAQLILRTGGPSRSDSRDVIKGPARLTVDVDGATVGEIEVGVPTGSFTELAVTLPGGPSAAATAHIRVRASAPYRAFHWFVVTP